MANLQLTKNLYEYRKANALTQKDVSEYLNISRQAYSNYETGKRDPDLGLLVKLSELYEISLNQLIVDSFRSSTLMFREVCPPYTVFLLFTSSLFLPELFLPDLPYVPPKHPVQSHRERQPLHAPHHFHRSKP